MDIVRDGSTLVLSGDLDARSTWLVRQAIHDHLDEHEDVALDLSDVEAVDHTALKVIAFATRRAHLEGQHLTLRGCGPAVRRMLHLSHLYRVVEVDREALTA